MPRQSNTLKLAAVVLPPSGQSCIQKPLRGRPKNQPKEKPVMLVLKQWIWFIGAAAWYTDSAVNLHYGARNHALLALIVATMFFIAGMVWVKTPKRP